MIRCIFLTGFMGAGKSTIGRILSKRLGWEFVDLDQVIESLAGKTIPGIFREEGEAAFRDLETETLGEIGQRTGIVVATGGGVVERSENRRLMKEYGLSVFLDVPWESLKARIRGGEGRPLADGEGAQSRLEKLFNARLPLYRQADLIIECRDSSPEDIAELIVSRLAKPSDWVWPEDD